MSTLRTNAILDASGGNTATVNGMTPTAQSLQGFRNRIINGDMRIDQRNAGASVSYSNSGAYTLDRWVVDNTTDGTISVQQSSVAPAGFTNSCLITVTTADASLSSTQRCRIRQPIEGFNVADFGFGTASAITVTLSFWVRSSLTGTFGGALNNATVDRSYPFSYTISAANTWEQKSVTIAGDTSGTWVTNSGVGLLAQFGLGIGSNFSGTANAWTGSQIMSTTGATSLIGTNGATFYITGVQLEAGSVATPFERRDYGTELARCQRYYELINVGQGLPFSGISDNQSRSQGVPFKVQKRTNPVVGQQSAFPWVYWNSVAEITLSSISYNGNVHGFSVNSNAGVGGIYRAVAPPAGSFGTATSNVMYADSEL